MDFYSTLGLRPGASAADIKRAYRRLARRYHPGINPGDRAAEAMFRKVSEAYETLVDPERRREYDSAGASERPRGEASRTFEFAGFDFSFSASGSQAATFTELFAEVLHPPLGSHGRSERGADLHAALTLPFEDAMRGVERQVVVSRQVTCGGCGGAGAVKTAEGNCPNCQGSGNIRWARGHMVFSKACASCAGTGRLRSQRCGVCAGHGRAVRSEAVPVAVPAGVVDGTRLRLQERGHAGHRGGPPGDLYVDVHVLPHHVLRREGDDILMVVPIAVHEAVVGARIDVPTLEGPVKLTVRPGTQGGQRLRVPGRGAPAMSGGRGDLIVEVKLVLPQSVDERSKDLMREFGRLNSEDVRRDLQL
jgi:molecular chaperone DnaJ